MHSAPHRNRYEDNSSPPISPCSSPMRRVIACARGRSAGVSRPISTKRSPNPVPPGDTVLRPDPGHPRHRFCRNHGINTVILLYSRLPDAQSDRGDGCHIPNELSDTVSLRLGPTTGDPLTAHLGWRPSSCELSPLAGSSVERRPKRQRPTGGRSDVGIWRSAPYATKESGSCGGESAVRNDTAPPSRRYVP